MSQRSDLKGRRVLVTGAAKRVGRDIALRLSREGARVLIHYNSSQDEARATAEETGAEGLLYANLESVPEIIRMFEEIGERFRGFFLLLPDRESFGAIFRAVKLS